MKARDSGKFLERVKALDSEALKEGNLASEGNRRDLMYVIILHVTIMTDYYNQSLPIVYLTYNWLQLSNSHFNRNRLTVKYNSNLIIEVNYEFSGHMQSERCFFNDLEPA